MCYRSCFCRFCFAFSDHCSYHSNLCIVRPLTYSHTSRAVDEDPIREYVFVIVIVYASIVRESNVVIFVELTRPTERCRGGPVPRSGVLRFARAILASG